MPYKHHYRVTMRYYITSSYVAIKISLHSLYLVHSLFACSQILKSCKFIFFKHYISIFSVELKSEAEGAKPKMGAWPPCTPLAPALHALLFDSVTSYQVSGRPIVSL